MHLLNPFTINIDPMNRLLLVNFEKDPDTLYLGFEPQVFDDTVGGKGHLVIGWRLDGRVDVYHEPGLKPQPGKFDIAGKGVANMIERQMPHTLFEISEGGVNVHYEFSDSNERTVIIRIIEKNPRKRKPFGLLAPMGSAAQNPSALPLVLLYDFYFVRKKHTEIEISIQGRKHKVDQLPLPMDWTKMLFTRYSPKPLIATLNPAFNGELPLIAVEPENRQIKSEEQNISLEWKDGSPSIGSITRNNHICAVQLSFKKPFPDIRSLAENTIHAGKFEITAHSSTGKITGQYTVENKESVVTIAMIPSGGWKPRPTKLSLRFLYTVAGIFKKWPTTYEWTATISKRDKEPWQMESGWKRI